MKTVALFASALLVALGLVGCGGGGGDGPVTSIETFQLRTAFTNYLKSTQTHSGTLSGTYLGVSVSGNFTVTQGALSAGTFEGVAAERKTTLLTGTITGTGGSVPIAASATSFWDSSYLPLGSSGGTDYEVVIGAAIIPATARVSDTALIFTANRYADSTKVTRRGTKEVTYAMEPDTASTALLKLIGINKDTGGTTTSTSSSTYRITPSGGLTRLSEFSTDANGTLTFTY